MRAGGMVALVSKLVAAVIVCAGAAGARADAAKSVPAGQFADLIEGCKRSPLLWGVRLECDGLLAQASDVDGADVKPILEAMILGIRAVFRGELTTAEVTYSAGGKSWPAIWLQARKTAGGPVFLEGHMLAVKAGPRTMRVVMCGVDTARPGGAKRCAALLPVLAEKGPATFAPPPREPRFLGEKIPVPVGCAVLEGSDDGFRIACGERAQLVVIRLRAKEDLAKLLGLTQQLQRTMPKPKPHAPRPCKLHGVATSCEVLSLGEGVSQVAIYVGSAVVEGVPVLVQCSQAGDQKSVHAACRPMLTF